MSDQTPSAQALLKSSWDQNVPQPMASGKQNVPQHQKATFEVVNRFMEAIILTKTSWQILSDDKYSRDEEVWKLAIDAQDRQQALAESLAGTPSGGNVPCGPSLKIDLQTQEALSLELCLMLLYQIDDIDYAPKYTYLELMISTNWGRLADGVRQTVARSYQLDMYTETELIMQVKEHQFDDVYLSMVKDDMISQFTRMDVLDANYHQFLFTANCLRHQPTTSL